MAVQVGKADVARNAGCVRTANDRARARERASGGPNMHTFVFRSYGLIVGSSEADLVRDVRLDVDKAQTKLKCIQRQLKRDQEHAAARADLLTMAPN
jgi:hypothetical protein